MAYAQAIQRNAYIQALAARSNSSSAAVPQLPPISTAEARERFVQGWQDGGGRPEWLAYVLDVVIPCESEWNVYAENPNGLYHGLGQWHWATWYGTATLTGLTDIYDPYSQGFNMAYKSLREGGWAWDCW